MGVIERIEDDLITINKEQWVEINRLKDLYGGINSQHHTWCQKHEDAMRRLGELINLQDSKIKGQGDFFNQRIIEFNKTVLGIFTKLKKQ